MIGDRSRSDDIWQFGVLVGEQPAKGDGDPVSRVEIALGAKVPVLSSQNG